MHRRQLLKFLSLAALGAAIPQGLMAQEAEAPPKRLIVILLRGGLDPLSVMPPLGDAAYYRLRPSVALPPPGNADGALPLDSGFGLHPALEPLMEFWTGGSLALITACGLADPIRTHAEAQKAVESGQPQERYHRDGWMGRLLPLLGPKAQALSLASHVPLILMGRQAAKNINPSGHPFPAWKPERPDVFPALDALYTGVDPLGRTYRQSQVLLRNKLVDLEREIRLSSGDAPSVHAFSSLAANIAPYLDKEPLTRLVFLGLGGIDAHFGQGAGKGGLAEALYSFSRGLAVLAKSLGPKLADTTVLVLTEFGRSVAENDYGGTDNGHGGMAMVLGGGVKGGKVFGRWPGLGSEALSDGKDLAVTTDFREIIASLCMAQFSLPREGLAQVLPGYTSTGSLGAMFA